MKKIWKYISNTGLKPKDDDIKIQQIKLLNQYAIIVSFVFFIHSIHNFFYIKNINSGYILLGVSLLFLGTFLLKNLRRSKGVVFSFFIFLCFIVFLYEPYASIESGIYLYYFPIVLAVPFIFDFQTDKVYVISIIICVILCLLININTDYSLLPMHETTPEIRKTTFFISLSISSIIVIIDLFFIFRKNHILYELYKTSIEKESLLAKQKEQLESFPDEKERNANKIQKLTHLVLKKDPSFFSAFNEMYPSFCPTLLNLAPDLSISELELCAYIKLNFTTKEIAQYTTLSIRAIEGRKYRIRKKLNFSSEKELITWMMGLDIR